MGVKIVTKHLYYDLLKQLLEHGPDAINIK